MLRTILLTAIAILLVRLLMAFEDPRDTTNCTPAIKEPTLPGSTISSPQQRNEQRFQL